jgi:uncharacterized coiled-coil DUF342 family protein
MSTSITGLDVLSILEVIKNEEVFTARINELRNEEKKLGEARFIAATVEQANKYRDEANELKREAVEMKLRIEAEVEAHKKAVESELDELRAKYEQDKSKIKTQYDSAMDALQVSKQVSRENEAEMDRLRKRHIDLSEREQALNQQTFKLKQRMAEVLELANKDL